MSVRLLVVSEYRVTCNDVTIPAALVAHSNLIYTHHLICSRVTHFRGNACCQQAWYIGKWLLLSILYTVSTLTCFKALDQLSVRQWKVGKILETRRVSFAQLTRVHFVVFTMGHLYGSQTSLYMTTNSRPSLTWKGIPVIQHWRYHQQQWVHELAIE